MNVIYGLSCKCHPGDGIRYVGQTSRGAATRLNGHLSEARGPRARPVLHWIRKHGGEQIVSEVLEVCSNPADLSAREIFWIAKLDTFRGKSGLNLTTGGEGVSGCIRSEETREKLRAGTAATWLDPEIRERRMRTLTESLTNPRTIVRRREIMAARWGDRAYREAQSEMGLKTWADPDIRRKRIEGGAVARLQPGRSERLSASQKAAWTDARKEQHAEVSRQRWSDPAFRERVSTSIQASWTPERREKKSRDAKERWADPEHKGKVSAALLAVYSDPEYRQRKAELLGGVPADVVREVRRIRVEDGLSYDKIGVLLGLEGRTVGRIVRGETYTHVA